VRQRLGTLIARVRRADLRVLGELIEAGQVMPVLDRAFPLSAVPDAIRYLRGGHAAGKAVIMVWDRRRTDRPDGIRPRPTGA